MHTNQSQMCLRVHSKGHALAESLKYYSYKEDRLTPGSRILFYRHATQALDILSRETEMLHYLSVIWLQPSVSKVQVKELAETLCYKQLILKGQCTLIILFRLSGSAPRQFSDNGSLWITKCITLIVLRTIHSQENRKILRLAVRGRLHDLENGLWDMFKDNYAGFHGCINIYHLRANNLNVVVGGTMQ